MPEVTEQTHAAKAVKTGIKPLLETEWSQGSPVQSTLQLQ